MKAYWGNGCIAPRILDLGSRWGEWSDSFPGRFTPRERAPWHPLDRRLVGPVVGLDKVVKRKIPNPFRDSNRQQTETFPIFGHFT